jgi:CRISPR-associated protein Cmr6
MVFLGYVCTWGTGEKVMGKKEGRKARPQGLQALQLLQSGFSDSIETGAAPQDCFPQLEQSPLQELKPRCFETNNSKGKSRELPESIFKQGITAEKKMAPLYEYLEQRIEQLAEVTLKVLFPWRLRVGGLPGFRDLLLPAMHPVYGVPYVPASSIKGIVRAWAKQQDDTVRNQVNDLFGYIDGKSKDDRGSIGKVQFLDAFPLGKCLDTDMANPQWHWSDQGVIYDPQPHALLSLQNATLIIGLKATSRGTQSDVKLVEKWLREALKLGIGSRASAGYGRSRGQVNSPLASDHRFELWSQGMYGATPPMKANGYKGEIEFRPSAIRGVLCYWFRAIGLGLYDADTVKVLEGKLFGTIQPTAIRGSLRISIDAEEKGHDPFHISGRIRLEAFSEKDLKFAQALLSLAFNLSGFGRGSRRPLHWNTKQLRGCHGELGNTSMMMDPAAWRQMIEDAQSTLKALIQNNQALTPGTPSICRIKNRTQDVLNNSAHIYLLKCAKVKHPRAVGSEDWSEIGSSYSIIGEGLQLLYSSCDYKGRSSDRNGRLKPGNPHVGGAVNKDDGSIPSYVLIKSIFPTSGDPYQVVTIFDVDGHADRAAFARAIKTKGGIQVWPLPS